MQCIQKWMTSHCSVIAWITHVHWEQGPVIMASWLQDIYLQLGFSPKAARLLIRVQGLDSFNRLRVLIDKNVDDICNVVMKLDSKNANGVPERGQQVSVIAQVHLKLAAFQFYHKWRCTSDWTVTGAHELTAHLLSG